MMKKNKTLSLEKYLQEISREPRLSAEEEIELSKKMHAGDRVALEKLVKANLRFVVTVANQYKDQGLSLPDLINEGNMGLIRAAEKFDETRGYKFISYAVWWIREGILRALAEEQRHNSRQFFDELPSPDTLIAPAGETASAETNRALSMLGERERFIIEHTFGINGQPEMTLDAMGESLGLSRERVCQIRKKSIRKLRAIGIQL
ncbi:MAG: sigma-70 family RNA polymerase sigma factor [Bacteroidaceae bacterium]|nr:sigma-70 family RNA polymerase sigma factor [Bacteroidaceae bacterium]